MPPGRRVSCLYRRDPHRAESTVRPPTPLTQAAASCCYHPRGVWAPASCCYRPERRLGASFLAVINRVWVLASCCYQPGGRGACFSLLSPAGDRPTAVSCCYHCVAARLLL